MACAESIVGDGMLIATTIIKKGKIKISKGAEINPKDFTKTEMKELMENGTIIDNEPQGRFLGQDEDNDSEADDTKNETPPEDGTETTTDEE